MSGIKIKLSDLTEGQRRYEEDARAKAKILIEGNPWSEKTNPMTDTITPESLRALGQTCSEFDWHGSVPKSADVVASLGRALIAAADKMQTQEDEIERLTSDIADILTAANAEANRHD